MCAKNKIFAMIEEVAENGVFEIWYPGIGEPDTKPCDGKIYIPYMMNDALECYIILSDAVLVGDQIHEDKQFTKVEIHKEGERYALVAKQGDDNTFTVFFQDAALEKKYYSFGSICHFWEKGQEQWAQLVYIIGTMYDKYAFLGEESCNEYEKALLRLIEFAPFRYHAPAKQLFEDLYETTKEGARKMLELAEGAGDIAFSWAIKLYLLFFNESMAKVLSKMLTRPSRYKLYDYIYKKAVLAANLYPERDYGTGLDLQEMRDKANERLLGAGFSGEYPEYVKGDVFVRVVEEHPFTIMDWESVTFRQRLMISECTGRDKGFNMGFFDGKNLTGYYCDLNDYC